MQRYAALLRRVSPMNAKMPELGNGRRYRQAAWQLATSSNKL
jgi:hypothetical protein